VVQATVPSGKSTSATQECGPGSNGGLVVGADVEGATTAVVAAVVIADVGFETGRPDVVKWHPDATRAAALAARTPAVILSVFMGCTSTPRPHAVVAF
jgi:hypothetical protein